MPTFLIAALMLAIGLGTAVPRPTLAQTGEQEAQEVMLRNQAFGTMSGFALDSTLSVVDLRRVGNPATSALCEISPHEVMLHSADIEFVCDILPVINAGDVGIERVEILVPEQFVNLNVTAVALDGIVLAPGRPDAEEADWTVDITPNSAVVSLRRRIFESRANIRISFTADAIGPAGSVDFAAVLLGSGKSLTPGPGDADGDPDDLNHLGVQIIPGMDPVRTIVTVDPPVVQADGTSASVITTVLLDSEGHPVPGKAVALSSSRPGLEILTQPETVTDAGGKTVGAIRSRTVGATTITAENTTDRITAAARPTVSFSRGIVLRVTKESGRDEVTIGDVVSYRVTVQNLTPSPVDPVRILDRIPPNFKFLDGSARMDGTPIPDPEGNRVLSFDLGTVPGFEDANGNRRADFGEPGFLTLSYSLVVGAGATPGDYVNRAVAVDICDNCFISNQTEAEVEVTTDPIFDLATIIGKVFHDRNGDGRQDPGEPGFPQAMVALDDGTYALTDVHGRYHFKAVEPGHRLVKLNLWSLPGAATATTDEAQVAWVTPGIVAKVNFGLRLVHDTEAIGAPPVTGLAMKTEVREEPLRLVGSAGSFSLLVNGLPVALPDGDVRLKVTGLDEVVDLGPAGLPDPLRFTVTVSEDRAVESWGLEVRNTVGDLLHSASGTGAPPSTVVWDGSTDGRPALAGGSVCRYQMEIHYADGGVARSPLRLMGINRSTALTLSLSDEAYEPSRAVLRPTAAAQLDQAVEILRQLPRETVFLGGVLPGITPESSDPALATERTEAMVSHLVEEEGLAENRLALTDGPRSPRVVVNGDPVPVEDDGRFAVEVSLAGSDRLAVSLSDDQSRLAETSLSVPSLDIDPLPGELKLAFGSSTSTYRVAEDGTALDAENVVVEHEISGRTEPGNELFLDGRPVPVAGDGRFTVRLPLTAGRNSYGLLVRDDSEMTRITNLIMEVTDRNEAGERVVVVQQVPNLTVQLPPRGHALRNAELVVPGRTDPGNRVMVNDTSAPVDPEGRFAVTVTLPAGSSSLVVEAVDPDGNRGRVSRDVEVAGDQLFLMAFADGVVGAMNASGYVEGTGQSEATEYYTEGRVAYYLKGRIAGKYLITSAFDTGRGSFNRLFKDLDDGGNDRLLTNIDPDRFYPVYGDGSVTVYDTDSQGKFYLAVESDELDIVVGNYALNLDDNELAGYQRTLYGGRILYQSASLTRYGKPSTLITVFGAQGERVHVRTELRATGGSLYYLKHRDIVEGGEQINLVVRDKDTGLVLSRTPQTQNQDYQIKYEEGRIWFNRPVASVVESASLVNQDILAGHPVFIEIEYEAAATVSDASLVGSRVQKQAGDHVAIGGTYVNDKLGSTRYEMTGVDAEVRFGENTRLSGEYVTTSGADSLAFVSDDGGLTYRPVHRSRLEEGTAWKATAELDVGEWFGKSDRVQLGGYVRRAEAGFFSRGNIQERGTERIGVNLNVNTGRWGRLSARQDRTELLENGASPADSLGQTDLRSLAWSLDQGRFGVAVEYQERDSKSIQGHRSDHTQYLAGRLQTRLTEDLKARIEHQNTLTGPRNDQTTLGVEYRLLRALSLQASGTTGNLGDAAEGGLLLHTEGGRFYLTERLAENEAGRTTATVLGAERNLGAHSRVYSEYQWMKKGAQATRNSLIGLERKWTLTDGFRFTLTGEHAGLTSGDRPVRRSSLSAGLSYVTPSGLRATTRNEVRYQTGERKDVQYLTNNNLEIRLHPDFSLLGRFRYSATRDRRTDETEATFGEHSVGLAYRPVHHDRLNGLARYTHLSDERPSSEDGADPLKTSMDVVSLEGTYDFGRWFELVEKLAYKAKLDRYDGDYSIKTHTYLSIHRVNLHVRSPIDLGTEYRFLIQNEADDRRSGWLNEVTWRAAKHLRLGVGYNYTSFSDNEFSDNDYSVHGWFLRVQGKY